MSIFYEIEKHYQKEDMKLGEIREFKGRYFKAVKYTNCDECAFAECCNPYDRMKDLYFGECAHDVKGNVSIMFKKVFK